MCQGRGAKVGCELRGMKRLGWNTRCAALHVLLPSSADQRLGGNGRQGAGRAPASTSPCLALQPPATRTRNGLQHPPGARHQMQPPRQPPAAPARAAAAGAAQRPTAAARRRTQSRGAPGLRGVEKGTRQEQSPLFGRVLLLWVSDAGMRNTPPGSNQNTPPATPRQHMATEHRRRGKQSNGGKAARAACHLGRARCRTGRRPQTPPGPLLREALEAGISC